MKLDALKVFGGVILFAGLFLTFMIFVVPHCAKTEITVPPGAVLCHKDPDCLEGQHCGFVAGYTAAVCIGNATSNQKNLPAPEQP